MSEGKNQSNYSMCIAFEASITSRWENGRVPVTIHVSKQRSMTRYSSLIFIFRDIFEHIAPSEMSVSCGIDVVQKGGSDDSSHMKATTDSGLTRTIFPSSLQHQVIQLRLTVA
jgi:hypothetical protein